tara:strand:+ start:107 stop:562 length:456 start_codon:yes stop_codon:yes gene_type:complete
MASSKDTAIGLKDAYVKGILDGAGPEASAEAGQAELARLAGKLGMEQGNTAGIAIDATTGARAAKNDGNPRIYITDGNRRVVRPGGQAAAFPLQGEGFGAESADRLSPRDRASAAQDLYSGRTDPDGLRQFDNNISEFYHRGMGESFTYGR